jgi:translocator protein
MTTYIPSLTLPQQLFASPAAAVLFPLALGTGVGFSVSRESNLTLLSL